MRINFRFLTLVVIWKGRDFQHVQSLLERVHGARQRFGALYQDTRALEGETFIGNLTDEEFIALPLSSKRIGGKAASYRGPGYPHFHAWEKLHFSGVYAQKSELAELGLRYASVRRKNW